MKENSLYDKKSLLTITVKKPDWKEIVKDAVAFSNSEGGVIEFGIEDNSEVPNENQHISDELIVFLENNIKGKSNGLQIIGEKKVYDNGGETICLHVHRSHIMATTSDGKVYLRNGDNSEPVFGEDLHRLAEDKGCYSWETQMTEYELCDCNMDRKNFIIHQLRTSERVSDFLKEKTDDELLRFFSLIGEDSTKLTHLGVTFIGKQSQRSRTFNSPTLQCIKYDNYGEKVNKWTWDHFDIAPDEIIEQVWNQIPDWSESQEISDGLFRKNISAYDREVIRELVCNALVHRSYSICGDIFINIHPDHIEIVNPGRLPLGITPDNILHKSKKRNPNYANLMRALKYMEIEGSGYDKMYEVLLQQGKNVPLVMEGDDYVAVKVERRIHNQQILQLMDYATRHYQLRQKQIICLGLIAMHECLTARELEIQLELENAEKLRPWINPLLDCGLVFSSRVKSRGIEYRINPVLLQSSQYKGRTTLKRIEDYRLKELILEDLKLYKEAQIGDIHQRVGPEINRKRIKRQIEELETDEKIKRRGSGRYTFYRLL